MIPVEIKIDITKSYVLIAIITLFLKIATICSHIVSFMLKYHFIPYKYDKKETDRIVDTSIFIIK